MIDRKLLKQIDFALLASVILLTGFGILMIFSATRNNTALNGGDPYYFAKRQLSWALLGLLALFSMVCIDYRSLRHWSRLLYIGNLLMLGLVLILGEVVSGTQGWFRIGPLSFQPSEVAKIAVIITLSDHLARKDDLSSPASLISPFVHVGIPMVLILLQPDFGTAMVFTGILFGMLYISGARTRHLLIILGIGLALGAFVIIASQKGIVPLLKEYQIKRFTTFINPYADKTGAGWNVIQSMIAVGSGGFFGKGLFQGSQTQLSFLPARHTDFIFSVVGEELGFAGATLVLALYFFLLWRCLVAAREARDEFGRYLAVGVTSMLLFHVLINVGMTLGVMPVTGIPLPFMSSGGSSLLANMLGAGIVLGVHSRRHKLVFWR